LFPVLINLPIVNIIPLKLLSFAFTMMLCSPLISKKFLLSFYSTFQPPLTLSTIKFFFQDSHLISVLLDLHSLSSHLTYKTALNLSQFNLKLLLFLLYSLEFLRDLSKYHFCSAFIQPHSATFLQTLLFPFIYMLMILSYIFHFHAPILYQILILCLPLLIPFILGFLLTDFLLILSKLNIYF